MKNVKIYDGTEKVNESELLLKNVINQNDKLSEDLTKCISILKTIKNKDIHIEKLIKGTQAKLEEKFNRLERKLIVEDIHEIIDADDINEDIRKRYSLEKDFEKELNNKDNEKID